MALASIKPNFYLLLFLSLVLVKFSKQNQFNFKALAQGNLTKETYNVEKNIVLVVPAQSSSSNSSSSGSFSDNGSLAKIIDVGFKNLFKNLAGVATRNVKDVIKSFDSNDSDNTDNFFDDCDDCEDTEYW